MNVSIGSQDDMLLVFMDWKPLNRYRLTFDVGALAAVTVLRDMLGETLWSTEDAARIFKTASEGKWQGDDVSDRTFEVQLRKNFDPYVFSAGLSTYVEAIEICSQTSLQVQA